MLELSWRGAHEIPLADGQSRKFLQDGDATRRGKDGSACLTTQEIERWQCPPLV